MSFRYVRDYDKLIKEVENIKGVKAAAPFVNTQAVSMSGSGVSGIIIKGIDADLEKTVSKISSFITFGTIDDLKNRQEGEPYGILLGKNLAFSLMAGIGILHFLYQFVIISNRHSRKICYNNIGICPHQLFF